MDASLVDPVTFVPKAHPERRLVAAIVAVSLLCVGLWLSGAVGPRLTAVVRSVEGDAAAGRGTLHIELRNDAPLAMTVRGVTVDDRGGPPVEVGPVLIGGRPLTGGSARLLTDDVVTLDVSYTVDCNRPGGYGADPELSVRVRAPLGVTQTRRIRTDAAFAARGGNPFDPGPLLCPPPSSFRTGASSRTPD